MLYPSIHCRDKFVQISYFREQGYTLCMRASRKCGRWMNLSDNLVTLDFVGGSLYKFFVSDINAAHLFVDGEHLHNT